MEFHVQHSTLTKIHIKHGIIFSMLQDEEFLSGNVFFNTCVGHRSNGSNCILKRGNAHFSHCNYLELTLKPL